MISLMAVTVILSERTFLKRKHDMYTCLDLVIVSSAVSQFALAPYCISVLLLLSVAGFSGA